MVRDNDDEMVYLLETIAQNTGGIEDGIQTQNQREDLPGQDVSSRTGIINPGRMEVMESDDLDGVSDGGAVTLSPGESAPVAYFRHGSPFVLLALGATDKTGVSYELQVNENQSVFGRTNSPLGLLSEPFSFVESLGGGIACGRSCAYIAHYDESESGTVEVAGRMFVEPVA